MRKLFIVAVAICSVFAVSSCKSSKENAYQKVYEEGRQMEQAEENAEIAPVASSTKNVEQAADTSYRTEKVVLASGKEGALKDFSVVCGSFSSKENAEKLRASLVTEGYNAIVAQNPETGMYRVICASFDTKEEAAVSRAQFKADHPQNGDFQKAWLLYNVK